ncbi:MAG: DEAD/DEAH box helicase, partial [Candidatus Humimicrobiaceae bacterium]
FIRTRIKSIVWQKIYDFLNPGLLGTQSYFKSKFYNPIQVYNDQEAAAKLKSVTSPFILRREKTDKNIISDLPEKIEIKDYCNLTKEQASLYKAVVDEMEEKVKQAEGIDRRGLILSTITKLKQVCNHPALFAKDNSTIDGRSGKLERLVGILAETIELGERSLVFTQYSQLGEMLKGYLQDYFVEEVFLLHGGTSRKKRDEMIDIFQGSGNAPHIFVLSIKAGGTGLNLTRANHVIHFDRWWNPAVENQATDRAFRIGQKRNVGVHKFIVAGTLEERIDEMIESKINVAKNVIGAGEDWLTELSNEDFYNLIKLSTEAIGE